MFWHAEEPQSVEYPVVRGCQLATELEKNMTCGWQEFAAALEYLIHAEDYIRVNHLPELTEQYVGRWSYRGFKSLRGCCRFQLDLATSLFDAGLVMKQTQDQMEADS
jgi:hypothetical protein